ncbi:MAG: hypothetical protein ACI38Y_03690 [Candidatus Methanomethylophilaceae archaeon]
MPCCICNCFITGPQEFVSADMFRVTRGQSWYDDYVSTCRVMGLDVVPFLDRMIVLDHIIAHRRSPKDYGIIRNPNDLRWLKPAPVFDNADSLGFGLPDTMFRYRSGRVGGAFLDDPMQQLSLVGSFDWLDTDGLDSVVSEVEGMIRDFAWIDGTRADRMVALLEDRVDSLRGYVSETSGP